LSKELKTFFLKTLKLFLFIYLGFAGLFGLSVFLEG